MTNTPVQITPEPGPNLRFAMETGAVCGLETMDEAVRNIHIHALSIYAYSDVESKLDALDAEYAAWQAAGGGTAIPKEIVEAEERRLRDYFTKGST